MDARRVGHRIKELGGAPGRQKGSHLRFDATYIDVAEDGESVTRTAHTTVQQHGAKDIPTGTLRKIQKDLEPAFGKGWLL